MRKKKRRWFYLYRYPCKRKQIKLTLFHQSGSCKYWNNRRIFKKCLSRRENNNNNK